MYMWQLCHLAMVVPIADAYYEADCLEKAGKEWKTERKTAKRLKRNFCFLKQKVPMRRIKELLAEVHDVLLDICYG